MSAAISMLDTTNSITVPTSPVRRFARVLPWQAVALYLEDEAMKRVLVLLSVTALVGALAMACGGGSADTSSGAGTSSGTGASSGGTDTTGGSTGGAATTDADAGAAPASSGGAM